MRVFLQIGVEGEDILVDPAEDQVGAVPDEVAPWGG
jgi:hypothetical protein